jgi:hypothetical protein
MQDVRTALRGRLEADPRVSLAVLFGSRASARPRATATSNQKPVETITRKMSRPRSGSKPCA